MRSIVDRKAVLIAGSEERHAKSISAMDDYLLGIGVNTVKHTYDTTAAVIASIKTQGANLSDHGILLVVIHAHGSKKGIENPDTLRSLTYSKIIKALPPQNRRVQFITATCYGHFLIKHLIGNRSGYSTGVITTWEGFKVTYDDTISDVRNAWLQRKHPEDTFKQTYSDTMLLYDCDFAPVQRWGAMHDKFFFTPT